MFEYALLVVTWLSILLIVYHHAGYPLLLRLLGRRKSRAEGPEPRPQSLPSVTIVMPAYNEESFIADKIRNLAILDYPADRLKIIVVDDGSTDDTYDVALQTLLEPECRDLSIKLVGLERNIGKIGVLNRFIDRIRTDIVALTDVSALISIDALQQAVRHFNDPTVGVVNGNYRLANPGSEGENQYWRYQSRLKHSEALIGSVIGSHGAFYLIRSHLFQRLPADTINDDFIIPMRIVSRGYRSVLADSINAVELEQSSLELDRNRRRRISAGNLQQAIRLAGLLRPRYRGTAFTFASGKFLRVFVPYLMLSALGGSLLLAGERPLFAVIAALQVLVYLQFLLFEALGVEAPPGILQTLNYLIRGHLNGLRGSLHYLLSLPLARLHTRFGRS